MGGEARSAGYVKMLTLRRVEIAQLLGALCSRCHNFRDDASLYMAFDMYCVRNLHVTRPLRG